MLHEIYCEQFHQKRIVFNPGLSVVLGTNAGDNSIGKSTFLLIVDYVFGGSTYAGTTDIIENVGSHDIYFSFIFGEEIFKFCRNSINAHTVWKCNDSYEKVEEIGLNDYCKWLDSKYAISLPELSFRDAVGRYIRVYGKNNCDERHPLHYQATEKAEKACTALLKLFDAYTPLKETEAAAQRSDAELTAYKKAQALQFIAKITKRVHDKNEKEIRSIAAQIEELSSGLERGLLDVDATASEQAVYIKKLLSRARRARSKVKARWDLLDENGNYAFSSTTDSFADLQHFFPEAAVAHLDEIEGFHRTISSVFKAELRSDRSKLEKELAEYDQIIHEYEAQLQELVQNPNLSKVVLTRHAELLREKDRMQKENDAYEKLQQLKEARDADAERLKTIKQQQLALVSYQLNEEMSRLNDAIQGVYQNHQQAGFGFRLLPHLYEKAHKFLRRHQMASYLPITLTLPKGQLFSHFLDKRTLRTNASIVLHSWHHPENVLHLVAVTSQSIQCLDQRFPIPLSNSPFYKFSPAAYLIAPTIYPKN